MRRLGRATNQSHVRIPVIVAQGINNQARVIAQAGFA
jgi:hypothetical protein